MRDSNNLVPVGFSYDALTRSYDSVIIFEKRGFYDGPVKYRYKIYGLLSDEDHTFLANIDGSIRATDKIDGCQWDVHTLLEFSREDDVVLFKLSRDNDS